MMAAVALAACSIEAAGTASADNLAGTSAPREPVQYRVKEASLIGNEIFQPGAIVSYDGLPSENLEPLCDIGRARFAEYQESNRARVTRMIEMNKESGVGDPAQFAAQFQKALKESNDEHERRMAELQKTLVEAQARAAEQMGAAVAQGVAAVLQQLFPNGVPTAAAPAAPTEPATPAAPADDPAATGDSATGTDGGDQSTTPPPKRTRS
jgi:hypothetical protein